jgi:stalled ribosome rescue protein Dom34
MKDIRPRSNEAVVVLVDARNAIIARCAGGLLTRIHSVRAPRTEGTSDHMGDTPRQSYHPGTRGETATDAAQRARAAARREFISDLSPIVAHSAAPTELIVVGGNRLFANALSESLAKSHGREAIVANHLHRALAAEEIVDLVTTAIAGYLAERDLSDVQMLLERTGAHTTGVVGPIATLDAAEHGAVDVVFMTRDYQLKHAAEAERIASATRAQNGSVIAVTDRAGDILDAQAGGVGALLRFALHKIPADLGERSA